MSSVGAAPRAAVPVSNARAEASCRNGAKSRGPKTPEGKLRSAQNALKHGLRAQKYVVLPDEDAAEFATLEAALMDELAPQGVLQWILVGRIARAAWRLDRAERLEVELFAERLLSVPDGGPGLALIRDGNGTRSFDTLLRYRGAAMAELMRSLRTLKALQAEALVPVEQAAGPARALEARAGRAAAPAAIAPPRPNKPERRSVSEYLTPDQPSRTLHELAACWTPTNPSLVGNGTKARRRVRRPLAGRAISERGRHAVPWLMRARARARPAARCAASGRPRSTAR